MTSESSSATMSKSRDNGQTVVPVSAAARPAHAGRLASIALMRDQ